MKLKIADIKIGERQRLDLGDIDDLGDSLQRLGQIHSIGVDENNNLIWGRRRLAAAIKIGWTEIEGVQRAGLTYETQQEIELEEDIKRKDRTWQEKCLATAKLFRIKARAARANGEEWTIRTMATFTGMSKSSIAYMIQVADALSSTPMATGIWKASNYMDALGSLRDVALDEAEKELNKRRPVDVMIEQIKAQQLTTPVNEFLTLPNKAATKIPGAVQSLDMTSKPAPPVDPPLPDNINELTLLQRAEIYNEVFGGIGSKNTPLYYQSRYGEEFIFGFWFVGGGNISSLYGSYQIEYLNRVGVMFADAKKVVHLFSGSLPPSDEYVRVGLPQDGNEPDIKADAHEFSSYLPFKADVIYADPPYSIEDSEHYANSMVNRERVLAECSNALTPGGYVVWLDQALPVFRLEELRLVGAIGYVRSTGNRFRLICIFRKPLPEKCQPITSSPKIVTTLSANQAASLSAQAPPSTGLSEFQ